MELEEAKNLIQLRYTTPTFEQLKKAFGSANFSRVTLAIDWKPIELYLDNDAEAHYADICMQLLQNVTVWDGYKKGIIRYISEDKDQLLVFVNCVNNLVIGFSPSEETDFYYDAKLKKLSYVINLQTQQIITSNAGYERLIDIFDEIIESAGGIDNILVASAAISGSSPVSAGSTPQTPRDPEDGNSSAHLGANNNNLSIVSIPHNSSKENLVNEGNNSAHNQGTHVSNSNPSQNNLSSQPQAQQPTTPSRMERHGSFATAPNMNGNNEFPAPIIPDPNDFNEDEILYTANAKSLEAVKQENNLLSTGRHIEDLKTICRQPRVFVNGDLVGIKYMLKQKSDLFWKATNDADAKTLAIAQKHAKKISQVMNIGSATSEQLIKVWKITKVNVKGLLQERILILTTLRLYTAKMAKDKETPQVDEKHFKHFDLINFVMVDVARFKPTSAQKLQPFGMCLYIRDPNKQPPASLQSSSNVEKGMNGDPAAPAEGEVPKKKKKKGIAAKIEKAVRKGSMAFAKRRESTINGDKGSEQKRERPKTDDLYKAYFMAPQDIHISEYQQRFLNEVAWCVYAAALALKRSVKDCYEPYEDTPIARPESSVSAFLYNKLGLGKN